MNKPDTFLVRFIQNRAAVVAVEFAFIAPILIVMFLGLFEVSDYVRATMRTDQVAQSVAALVARQASLTNGATGGSAAAAGSITDYCYAGLAVLYPYSSANLTLTVASYSDDYGTPTRDWAVTCPSSNTSAATTGFTPTGTIPTGLLVANGDSVIIVSATYQWNAPDGGLFLKSGRIARDTAYARPRSNSTVTCPQC